MTRFEVLKNIENVDAFSDLIIGFADKYKTSEELSKALMYELTEEELQTLKNAAQNGYPLFFSGIQ